MLNPQRLVPVAAVLFLAACSADDGAVTTTTVAIRTTDFVTIPPVETTPPGPSTIPEIIEEEQEYTIVAGDYPLGVAAKFGITLDELVQYNGWVSADAFPFPGTVIRIPPGSKNPAASATATPSNDPGLLTVPPDPVTTLAGGQPNSGEGTYVIVVGDFPLRIAEKFDVTLEALAAANGWEDLQRDFPFPGTTIIIPAKTTG
jgi:LysM repeat protein